MNGMWEIHSAWPQSAFILRNWAANEDEGKQHANFKCWEYRCLKPLKSRQGRIATTLTKMPNNLKISFLNLYASSLKSQQELYIFIINSYHLHLDLFVINRPYVYSAYYVFSIYMNSAYIACDKSMNIFFFIDAGFNKLLIVLCIH